MATTKLQYISDLAEKQGEQITRSRQNWAAFLNTAANLYKYPFHEQLMIFAQCPNAQAVAPIETWNKPFNYWVRRNAKGIAIVDAKG